LETEKRKKLSEWSEAWPVDLVKGWYRPARSHGSGR